MKNLQGCLIYFVGGVILAVAITGAVYVHEMSPTWNDIARRQAEFDMQIAKANAMTDIQAHEQRSMAINTGSWVLVALLLGTGLVMWWREYDKRHESKRRAVDGTFALQTFSANGFTYHVDPNKALFGVVGFDKATGGIITDAQMTGPDRQLEYAVNVQKTRTVAAKQLTAGKPSRNELMADAGVFAAKEREASAKAKLAEMRLLAHEAPALDDGNMKALPDNWQPLTLVDAFRQSTPDRWLLGQNDEGVCEFDITSVVHTGLLGATKCGKTSSTALLMAMNAAKDRKHVIALDGAGGVDWQPYSDKFEVYETDYSLIGDQLDQIIQIHDKRTKALKLAGKPNIDELDYHIPSLFVILEEFGRTMQAFKSASNRQYDATVSALSNLMRVSRKTGIYFLVIDQSMAGWDQRIKPNIKDYISYHLGGNQGAAFNAYKLHELKPKGQFWNNGSVYDAWYTRGEAKELIKQLPARKIALLTDTSSTGTVGTDTRGEGEGEIAPPGTDTSSTGTVPLLSGKPISPSDKQAVLNVYAMTQSINETCRLVWGGKSPSRMQWVNELIKGEALQ